MWKSFLDLAVTSLNVTIRVLGAIIWGGVADSKAELKLFQPYGLLALIRGTLNLFRHETKRTIGRGDEAVGLLEAKEEQAGKCNCGIILKMFGLMKDGTIFAGTWFAEGAVASEIFIAASLATLSLVIGKAIYKKYQKGRLTTEEEIQIALDCLSSLGTIAILVPPGKAIVDAKAGQVSTYHIVTASMTTTVDSIASLLDFYKLGRSAIAVKKACTAAPVALDAAAPVASEALPEHSIRPPGA